MAKWSGNIRTSLSKKQSSSISDRNYYAESMKYRAEVLATADNLKGKPLSFTFDNGISGKMEITRAI